MKKLAIVALSAAFLVGLTVPPKPASACPLMCRYVNGHWVCGCG